MGQDTDLDCGTTTLYRCFGQGGRLLYVGITNQADRRFMQHRANKPWWPSVVKVTTERYPTLAEARDAETAAIKQHRPPHNVQHNGDAVKHPPRVLSLRSLTLEETTALDAEYSQSAQRGWPHVDLDGVDIASYEPAIYREKFPIGGYAHRGQMTVEGWGEPIFVWITESMPEGFVGG